MENQTHTTDGTAKNENDAVVNEGVGYAGISVPEPPKIVRSERAIEVPGFEETEETPKPSYEELEDQLAKAKAKISALEAEKSNLIFEVNWRAQTLKAINDKALEGGPKDSDFEIYWRAQALQMVNDKTIKDNQDHPFPD